MKKMYSFEERERYEKEVEDLATALFLIERLFLCILLVISSEYSVLIGLLLLFTSLLALTFFFLCPRLSSAGPSGIGGFWLFLSDRFMFLLALSSHETVFLWRLAAFISLANHFVYIIEYLVRSYKPQYAVSLPPPQSHNDEIPIYNELRGIDDEADEEGIVIKEVEKTRELLEELREDEKKMDIEMEFIEHITHLGLETHRKNLSEKLLELSKELRDDGEKMRKYMELMKNFVYSELGTLRDDLRLYVDESWEDVPDELRTKVEEDIKAWREEVKYVADEVHETYLVIQGTAIAAKTIADRAHLTYLVVQAISAEIQNKRWLIRAEAIEGFQELREEVRQMSLDFEVRKMEAEIAADRATEELSCATVELLKAIGIRQWEEYKTD